jgi:hypothetical protein
MVTLGTLTPFWITFPKDGNEGFPLGFGVTAWSEADAWRILDERGYDQHRRAGRVDVKPLASVDQNGDEHVRKHMGPIVVRGIWYPFTQLGAG